MAVPLRWGIAGVLLGVAALSCRKEPAGAASPTKPAASGSAVTSDFEDVATRARRPAGGRAPVIWLGLDGLDFEVVDRLAAEGRMPNWKRLASEGYTARLKSFIPILSPIVWTTLATGVGPDVHRVLDFQEVDPANGQKVPISGNSRAVPAIWNVASAEGLSVGVVGWWASHPAEEVRGFFVSDHASTILFQGLTQDGIAFPASLAPGVGQIMARDGRVEDAELTRFLDMRADEIARERASAEGLENPVVALARTIGATRVASRIARELYDRNLPDLTMLYFEGTDVIGHLFASDVAPRLDCVRDEDFRRFHRAADEYYAMVDRLLGQWMRRAEEDGATLIVNSDHGFKWGADRSCEKGSRDFATAAFWHRLEGVFAAWGAKVRKGVPRGSASVFDVEPTVAALLGLPVDARSTGKPIRAAFDRLPEPARKDLSAIPVQRLAGAAMSEKDASEYAKKLMALGYLSGGEPGKLVPSGGTRPGMTEGAWNNLGMYWSDNAGTTDLAAAETALRKALELRPDYSSPMLNLAAVDRLRGDDRQAIDWVFRALAAGRSDPEGVVLDWALTYQVASKNRRAAREVLERGAQTYPDSERIHRALALDDYASKRCPEADQTLGRFEAATRVPETLNALALIRACLGRKEEASNLFRRSLAINPNQETVVRSLAVLEGGAPEREKAGS
jgi:Flp pilus assembly protein TadD